MASIITACGSGINSGSSGSSKVSTPQAIIPPQITIAVAPHVRGSAYYVESMNPNYDTNNPYYNALIVTNKSAKSVTLSNINMPQNDQMYISNLAQYYPSPNAPMCINNMQLARNGSCSIVVYGSNYQNGTSPISENLSITAAGVVFNKILTLTPYLYAAGTFTQVYANPTESINAVPAIDGGFCGSNQDKACQIIALNLANHQVSTVATADYTINSLTVDNDLTGNIYFAGGFSNAAMGGRSITTGDDTKYLIASINPVFNDGIGDFIANTGQTEYPDDVIYTLKYWSNQLRLLANGGFTHIAGLPYSGSGYPLVGYDLTGVVNWQNQFANGNPDYPITAIGGGDGMINLFMSGLYGTLDGHQYLSSDVTESGTFVLNSCISTGGGQITCSNNSYALLDATNNSEAFRSPANSINSYWNNDLYIAGGFSQIINNSGSFGQPASTNYIIGRVLGNAPVISSQLDTLTWDYNFGSNYYPNSVINTVMPITGAFGTVTNPTFVVGGWFSSIGGIAADNNPGQCGANATSFAGTQSCLLAMYDGSAWQKLFTTDGIISSVVYSSVLTVN